ncbi:MAG TPA: RNA polymerase sigma factor [Rhizomicrobium sp.]|nr:RNA polymerase sigma factor [Rhizomicrobium sp.]
MADIPESNRENADPHGSGSSMNAADVNAWFVREVLPLEAGLIRFLSRRWRNQKDVEDLLQDVYMRVYEAAQKELPHPARPFVFTVARNLLINRSRREHVVAIQSVADVDLLNVFDEEPGPERNVMAREELVRLQEALDQLPPRARQAVILRKIEGLSRREIAERMGITEQTVNRHLTDGMYALTEHLWGKP